jgi:hypothetical protein
MESAMSPDGQSINVAAYQQRKNGVSPLSSSFGDRRLALAKRSSRHSRMLSDL